MRSIVWFSFVLASSGAASPLLAQDVLHSFAGDSVGDGFGAALTGGGDVDGDGVPDLFVGAPLDDNVGSNSGSARVFSGGSGAILFTLFGDSQGDQFGFAVDLVDDLDGDASAELFVGAHLDGSTAQRAGSAYVFSGSNGALLATLHGEAADDEFGYAVAGAGDVDGDGTADLLVGAPFADHSGSDSGRLYVYSGASFLLLRSFDGESEGDHFGFSVASAGDLDGDSMADVMAGAPFEDAGGQQPGVVRALSVATGAELLEVEGEQDDDRFGESVASVGDLDGDGLGEILVGAPFADNGGRAYRFSGANGLLVQVFTGGASSDRFGRSVAGAGDVNGDGSLDLLVGDDEDDAPGANGGTLWVYSGADHSNLFRILGEGGSYFGHDVAGAGDINADGRSDFAAGGHRGQSNHGVAIVFADAQCPPPESYCIAAPNSAGAGALIGNTGSTSIAANDFTLTVIDCPLGQNGIFFYGVNENQLPFGDGFLCVGGVAAGGGGIFRLQPPIQTDANGEAARLVDFTQPPACCGEGAILPASTWYFQFWYRDPAFGGAGFNLSDGLKVVFCL